MRRARFFLFAGFTGALAAQAAGCIVKTDIESAKAGGASSTGTFSATGSTTTANLKTESTAASSDATTSALGTTSSVSLTSTPSSDGGASSSETSSSSSSISSDSATSTDSGSPNFDCSQGLSAIEDPVLRNIASVAMNNPTKEGKPSLSLDKVTWLGSPFSKTTLDKPPKIKSLSGLECAHALKRINLRSEEIENLGPLNRLEHLEGFSFGGNPSSILNLSDIPERWPTLQRVELQMLPGKEDVAWMSALPKLTELGLLNTGATNRVIEEIARLKRAGSSRLRELLLDGTLVDSFVSIEPYGSDFDYLELRNTKSGVLSSLSSFTRLQNLRIYYTKSKNLEFLPTTGIVRSFYFIDGGLESLSGLRSLGAVKTLILSNNQISNIEILGSLKQLVRLSLANNPRLSDIGGLAPLSQLSELNLSSCSISDLEPLRSLSSLTQLKLSGNPGLSDLRALGSLSQLELLSLSSCNLVDVSPLADLVSLEESKLKTLDLSSNPNICSDPSFARLKALCVEKKVTLKSSC